MSEAALTPGKHLRYSLSRQSSRGAQIGCTLAIALLLGGIGGAILYAAISHDEPFSLMHIVGGGFAFFALPLLYSAVHQLFALRTPETVVEIDADVLQRGSTVRLYFRQPGPASFESLRANLVGEESWWTGSGKSRRQEVRQLGTFSLFDSGAFDVDALVPFERTVSVQVPNLPPPSNPAHSVMWQLEVWGKVRRRADIQHVFPMKVAE